MSKPDQAILFAPEDEPLRRDVRELGALLGDVLREQAGDELFERVETARKAARRRRQGDAAAEAELVEVLAALSPELATELIRAFSAYFSLVNMAERVHWIRLNRARGYQPALRLEGSLVDAVQRLQSEGVEAAALQALLDQLAVVPVFTAHPTEVSRRTQLAQEQQVARALVDRIEQPAMTPREQRRNRRLLREQVTLMWQTAEQAGVGRTVADEVEHVLFYLTEVIFRVVPAFYEAFGQALRKGYPDQELVAPCPLLRFGSWVGGDMDGNPRVGAETIRVTLRRQRELILERYRRALVDLRRRLSQSRSRVDVDAGILERGENYRAMFPAVAEQIPARHTRMPYRVLLSFMLARLDATEADGPGRYLDAEDFVVDLRCIATSLRQHRGQHAGLRRVERLICRAETFGFHLATLDVRQDAVEHRQAVASLLGDADFADRAASERTRLLEHALADGVRPVHPQDGPAGRALAALRAIGESRERYGERAVGPYIVSMAQGPDDALAVLYLARCAGLVDAEDRVPLDVAPLFETVDDLDAAAATMRTLFADPRYRVHLRARGDEQLVMVGYSDSSKDGGLAASRWALYQAQDALVGACAEAEVGLTIFHGRGGTVSRGGGKPRDGILAEPPGAVRGRLRVTEQGEIIHTKYGLRGSALQTLEMMTGAVLEASAHCEQRDELDPTWVEMAEALARSARQSFRALVYERDDFLAYFRTATPVDVIERLQIGSRPVARRAGQGIQDLRAIPWVFAWMQNRHLLPGWYGLGSGLQAVAEHFGEERLQEAALGWPLLTTLLADVEMVLAKADMTIAARYAELAGEPGQAIFTGIREEYGRTRDWVCRLRGVEEVLDREPFLQRVIRLRNPYVDPMSLLQVDLLRRWREGGREDEALLNALLTTVRGIARGMQNSG